MPLPGASFWLEELRRAGFGQALATSIPRANPEPEIFLLAANASGAFPDRCMVIEDMPAGVEAARRAGMRCTAVTTSSPREILAEADLVLDSLEDLALHDFEALLSS